MLFLTLEVDSMEFRLGELFSGPGGLALGAIQASFKNKNNNFYIKHAWSNDIDIDSCNTYKLNICPESVDSVICGDVKELDIDKLSPIDCFAYGFPCNDFSIVGEQKGFQGEYGPLYMYGINIIEKFNPRFFVAENVGGLASANEGKAFERILSDLGQAGKGYNITANLYKSEQYGIPQTRHRIIIVGIRKDEGILYKVPKPTHMNNPVTAGEAILNPPILFDAPNNEITKQSKIVEERLRYIKPGENVWNANLPEHLKLNVKNTKLSQIYKRLDPNKPSYTITGSGGGGTHGYHWLEPRALTNRERARIQTFPDNFIFTGSKEKVRKQIGMAVPPLLSNIVFSHILMTFAKVSYPFVPANISEEFCSSDELMEKCV